MCSSAEDLTLLEVWRLARTTPEFETDAKSAVTYVEKQAIRDSVRGHKRVPSGDVAWAGCRSHNTSPANSRGLRPGERRAIAGNLLVVLVFVYRKASLSRPASLPHEAFGPKIFHTHCHELCIFSSYRMGSCGLLFGHRCLREFNLQEGLRAIEMLASVREGLPAGAAERQILPHSIFWEVRRCAQLLTSAELNRH